MINYSFTYICDKCGAPIAGHIYVVYPQTVLRDEPTVIPDEEPDECEALREGQINHVYCRACTRKILAFANLLEPQKKRGRKPKTE